MNGVASLWLRLSLAIVFGAAVASAAAQPIRDVTPQGVTKVYREDGRQNFRERGEFLESVRVQRDGSLATPAGPVRLYGVKLREPRELCRNPDGGRWACGARAMAALRGFIDEQSIECVAPKVAGDITRICWRGNTNISVWLLEQGWAELADASLEKEYLNAVSLAKAKRAGLWSNGQDR